ncbi:hypothetical protein HCN44_010276 [Aphidius gifuensis]|uniref:Chaoptin n=1 Tax=Aphidius gifuensis TaxID=684658 RepID=A0A834XX21_APHGI|nr:hypothetical protein HCN44_010276 [Aphidius gifuensis]
MLPPLNKLLYTGGSIIILHSESLICLPKLSIFKITATNLATLEEDAFFGLDNLLTINLSHNNLTHIPNNVFNKLNKLNELTLHHNSIKTIEMGALVLNHAMKFVNISNNQLERITAGTFKGMICDYLDLSGNIILSHERNILALTEIKKSNINGHVSTRGHASKSEDPPINDYHVSWTSWGLGCDDEGKLIPYKPEYINSKNNPEESVEYKDNSINIIHDFVFYDSPSYRKTKSLKLRLSNGILIISPLTFHLSKLEHLEITPGSVMLEPKTFQRLNHLKSLKLKVNETDVSFYQVLPNFPNLESLELIEYEFESICDPWNTHLNISSLNYTASIINKLSSGSFRCLPNLKSLIITRTNVSVIVFGAFENLKNLERLELTSNWGITSIPRNFLHELTNLKILNLANNSILRIDSDAFAPINNNCQILNLSYNFLEFLEYGCFKNFECETVDLGGNNIQYIGSNEFKNSIIIRLFLDDNIINKFDNKRRWGLQNSTTVYFKYNYYETVTNTDKNYTHCYESDQDIYVICKKLKYISSVSQKVLPYRLLPTTLAIYDNGAYGINSDAFVDLSIETLIIESSADAFHVRENSFMNMKKLKNLQLITSRIILNEGSILPIKDTLENLTLSVDELYVYLCKTIEMGALVLNHAMKFVNVSNNQLVNIKAGTFKGMKCDYLDLSGNKILSHEINILGLADIKKWNINGHIGFQGHATKAEDP